MRRKRLFSLLAILTLVISLVIAMPAAHGDGGDDDVSSAAIPEKTPLKYPNLGSHLNQLAAGVEAGRATAAEAAGETAMHREESVAVTIHLSGNVNEVVTFLRDNGGDPRNVGEDYIEAYVPVTLLGPVSEQPGVIRVREIAPPQPAQLTQQIIGHGPAAHGSAAWNQAGYNGQGIKVGIIDDFRGISALRGIEVPTTVVARCYTDIGAFTSNLADCEDVPSISTEWARWPECVDPVTRRSRIGYQHGTEVAESLLDIAPGVSLYIANPPSRADLQAAVDWMVSQGVQVINYSAGWTFDGPGDGTSPLSVSPLNTVDRAVNGGVLWVNSAGNNADSTWFGDYSDPDGDNLINVGDAAVNHELNGLPLSACRRYRVQLRWEDRWRGANTDLNIYLYDRIARAFHPTIKSEDPQSGESGHDPFEMFVFRSRGDSDRWGIVVEHHSGPAPEWIQVTVWGAGGLEDPSFSGSINNPAESANPGLLAVGAAPWYDVQTIEDYSSAGPTPDDRTMPKPDIVAADCGETTLSQLNSRNRGFCGTSQSAPHVAGLAALVKQRFPSYGPVQIANYLKSHAQQRGSPDPNNTWGHGFAQLPSLRPAPPPTPPPAPRPPSQTPAPTPQPEPASDNCSVQTLAGDGTTNGQWAPDCESSVFGRGHARYYTFTLAQESEVTITLESDDADTYLYLRQGDARSGAFLHENDDHEGSLSVSQIQATLPAGIYTIETTTYSAGVTGSFTLTASGLGSAGGGGPSPDPTPTDACGQAITADGSVSGQWAPGCQSEVNGRGYARYYAFTLAAESDVTIILESSDADTYLYLRQGDARSGAFLHENDDHEGSLSVSQIKATLPAGSYTIEATTYSAGVTGDFTLTVSGLGSAGGGGPSPDPTPTDACGQAITADGPVSGQWAPGCQSEVNGRGYARYYAFTLAAESDVAITLESSDADTYLYLRQGDARSGAFLHENDDHEGSLSVSQIQATLPAGSYTIETTTYSAGVTGSFTLTVSGLGSAGGGEPSPDPTPTDACGQTVTADGPVSGQWASGCQSEVNGRGYARYYAFTLAAQSDVTITLESSDADTYLYLRQGDARSGAFLHENDDHEGSLSVSRIQATLLAGSYTIEATTYSAGVTGGFTLTISGLGSGAGVPVDTALAPLGDNLLWILHYDNASGSWSGYDPSSAYSPSLLPPDPAPPLPSELKPLRNLVDGGIYWLAVAQTQTVTLGRETVTLYAGVNLITFTLLP